jgi:hypothetical protein
MRTRVVPWLLRLYPKAWRREYGDELTEMLRARPLTARVCSDVVFSALWQRTRTIQVPTWVGIGFMLVMTGVIAANIVDPPPYVWAPGQSVSEQPELADQVKLVQRPMQSELFVLVMAGIGFWSALRGKPQPARAAIRVWLIASIPLAAIGMLMVAGVLRYIELHPGQTPLPFDERGLVYVVYKAPLGIPASAPVAFLWSPLLRLPGACLWAVVGGLLGQKFAGWRRRPANA